MSVVGNAAEMSNSPRGSFETGKYTIIRDFRVIVNSKSDDPIVVVNAPLLPIMYEEYPTNSEMRVRHYDCERIAPGGLVWKVTVTYETPSEKEGKGGGDSSSRDSGGGTGKETEGQFENPTLELPTVKFHVSTHEDNLTLIYDTDTGVIKPVTASNGKAYDPPPKYLVRTMTLEISRNESIGAPHPDLAIAYLSCTNADVFWGQLPGVWMCKDITAERAQRQIPNGAPVPYLKVTYQFEAKANGWDLLILDSGDVYLAPPLAAVGSGLINDLFAPMLAVANSAYGAVQSAGAPTLTQTRFREVPFVDVAGHPRHGPLNGQGGPLPPASTFTADSSTDKLTVPAATAASPGVYVNGLAVQVYNTGGSLPQPLVQNGIYYTMNADPANRTVQLTSSLNANYFQITSSLGTTSGATSVSIAHQVNLNRITAGMTISGPGVPNGTTVTSVTSGIPNDTVNISSTLTETWVGNVTFAFVQVGSAINLTTNGSGNNTINPLGVFARIRPYNQVAFAPLGLPQAFLDCQ